jgi:hypothetical protein
MKIGAIMILHPDKATFLGVSYVFKKKFVGKAAQIHRHRNDCNSYRDNAFD